MLATAGRSATEMVMAPPKQSGAHQGLDRFETSPSPPTLEETWEAIISGDLERIKLYLSEHASLVVKMVRAARARKIGPG